MSTASQAPRHLKGPLLDPKAAALGISLEEVAAAASLYFLPYGLMQHVWAFAPTDSDRCK